MNNDQSLKTATMMTVNESDVLLTTSTNGKSDWILDPSSAYHLCGDREMFSTYVACDDRLIWMANNTANGVVSK